MKIIVDAMGGDNAPEQIVLGAAQAVEKRKDLQVVLVGKEDKINEILKGKDTSRLQIVNATEEITNNESPTMAVKLKRDSSLVKGLEMLANDEEAGGFVSAGSTGAVLVGAFMKVGRIKGVSRPALAPVLPTLVGKGVILCDCGANIDSKPINLLHYAVMASSYAEAMLGVKNPRVGLLNNGVEEHKGNELTREAYELLKSCKLINFIGNCEARDILTGDFDVVVSDGFDGNIALKSAEGTANVMLKLIKDGVYNTGLRSKLGGLLLKPVFKKVQSKMDYNRQGGACFLGVKKVIVKSHGSSKAEAIANSILQAYDLSVARIPEKIKVGIDAVNAIQNQE